MKTVLPALPGIYQIVNNTSEKRYVGYASSIRARINGHKYQLRNNIHPNNYLQKAYNKYGENNFSFKVLQLCSKDDLCYYEDYWVKILKVEDEYYGFNLKPTNSEGIAGHSQNTINKFKSICKNRKWSPQAIEARNAIPMTDEHKQKTFVMSQTCRL